MPLEQLGDLVSRFRLDYRDGLQGLKRVETQLQRAELRVQKFSAGMSKAGTALSIGFTLPLLAAAGGALKLAMDAEESENLFIVSMGNMEKSGRDFSESLREQFGLNAYAVRENLGMLNQMLVSMGLNEQAAFDMASGMTQLAYDMASFFNLKPEEAFEKLRAGITGEAEPLKRLGIIVNETTIKMVAYEAGIAKVGTALTEQQKIQARYLTIMKATAKAQGDLGRTLESPVNQLRILKERATEIGIEFGKSLIPFLQDTIPILSDIADHASAAARAFAAMDPETRKLAISAGLALIALGPMLKIMSPLAHGAGLATIATIKWTRALRGATAAQAASTAAAPGFVSANVAASTSMAATARAARLLQRAFIPLAVFLAVYDITSGILELTSAGENMTRTFGLAADKDKEWIKQLASDEAVYRKQIDLYNKMRLQLGLVGAEYMVTADHTKENAERLAELIPGVQDLTRELHKQMAAQAKTNRETLDATTIIRQIKDALREQDAAIESVTEKTRKLYDVISQKEAEEQMAKLVTDFKLLASDGASASQLFDAFGPKVADLAEAAKDYVDLDVPGDFGQLEYALKNRVYFDGFVNDMANRLPDAASKASAALEGTAMTAEKGTKKAREEIDELRVSLDKLATGQWEVDLSAGNATEEIGTFEKAVGLAVENLNQVPGAADVARTELKRLATDAGGALEGGFGGGIEKGVDRGRAAYATLRAEIEGQVIEVPIRFDTEALQRQMQDISEGRIPDTSGGLP